jgi:hypothetical protein
MVKNNNTFIKKQKTDKRLQKRKAKMLKKQERKEKAPGGPDDMIAYVDKYGNITSEPPVVNDEDENSSEES